MRVVTIVSLGASAVLGLGALFVAKSVLPNAANAKVPALAARPVEGVPVVVAVKPLKYGDKLDASQLTIAHLPPEAVPEGAFTTIAAVLSQDNGGAPVAIQPIAAREPLLPAKLSGPGARRSVAAEIADGMRAYTIRVSDAAGVGGHALPGDRVDVVLTRDLTPDKQTHNYVSQVLIQDVRVLAIDLNADPASDKPATPTTATLEVAVADGQKLAAANEVGKLSLALRRTGEADIAAAAPISARTFGAAAAAPDSGAPVLRHVARRYAPAPEGGHLITIVEGDGAGSGSHKPKGPVMTITATAPLPTHADAPKADLKPSSDMKPTLG